MQCDRRTFFYRLAAGALGLGFGVSIFPRFFGNGRAWAETGGHDLLIKGTVDFKGFIAKEITPNEDFYVTSYSDKVPTIDPETFRLRIEGLVEQPLALSLADLHRMQDKREWVTLECIGNPVGGDAIGNALWEGVTLKQILGKAGPKQGVVKTAFFAAEEYSDSIPYALADSGDVFLAFSMNGHPLPPVHGFPLRVVVPGIFGMKNVKWLTKIELVDYDFKGYWEKKGWSDEAVIPTMSEILMPMDNRPIAVGHNVIGGIAFGGRHGISRVQISIDDGNWENAELKPALSPWAWNLWRFDWTPAREGEFTIKVRAFDRSGKEQVSPSLLGSLLGTSFPDGAHGIHGIKSYAGSR